jgi:hypothetical protein
MDGKTIAMAGAVFVGGFCVAALAANLFEPHTQIKVQPMTANLAPTFKRVPQQGEPGAPTEAEMAAVQRQNDQVMENFRTGNFSDSQISEGADDAPLNEGHYFHTVIEQYNGIDRWRPASGMKVACFAGRSNKATVHAIAHFDAAHFSQHVATLNEWVFSGCSDALGMGHVQGATTELNQTRYLKTLLAMVPDTAEYAAQRQDLGQQIKKRGFFGG